MNTAIGASVEPAERAGYHCVRVIDPGRAAEAGLREDDLIVAVEGAKGDTAESLMSALQGNPGDGVFRLIVVRPSGRRALEVPVIGSTSVHARRADRSEPEQVATTAAVPRPTEPRTDRAVAEPWAGRPDSPGALTGFATPDPTRGLARWAVRHPVYVFWLVWGALLIVGIAVTATTQSVGGVSAAVLIGFPAALLVATKAHRARPTEQVLWELSHGHGSSSRAIHQSGILQSGFTARNVDGLHVPWRVGRVATSVIQTPAAPGAGPTTQRLIVSIDGAPFNLLDEPVDHPNKRDPDPSAIQAELHKRYLRTLDVLNGPMGTVIPTSPMYPLDKTAGLSPEQKYGRERLQMLEFWLKQALHDLDIHLGSTTS